VHAALGDFLLDLAQNALEAGADRVRVWLEESGGSLKIGAEDNGRGMDPATQARAVDPFFTDGVKHAKRRFGLGLPFLAQAAEAAGGGLTLESEPGRGTRVEAEFERAHPDTPPTGNLPTAVMALMSFAGHYELIVERRLDGEGWTARRSELKEALGSLDGAAELTAVKKYIASLEEELQAGRDRDG